MSCARHDCGSTREALVSGCLAACQRGGLLSAVPVRRPPTRRAIGPWISVTSWGAWGRGDLGGVASAAGPETSTARVGVN